MKIRVIWPGKTKKNFFRSAIEDYASRIRRLNPFEIVETKEESVQDSRRRQRVIKESKAVAEKRKAPITVVLNSKGKQMTSEEFASWLEQTQTDVDFILGGPEGLKIDGPVFNVSFGRITLPHELARVILLEQIYRALTILKRIPYHK
jgi:23S rRNA (pseudouridine1915-N3)-methyltransferase